MVDIFPTMHVKIESNFLPYLATDHVKKNIWEFFNVTFDQIYSYIF